MMEISWRVGTLTPKYSKVFGVFEGRVYNAVANHAPGVVEVKGAILGVPGISLHIPIFLVLHREFSRVGVALLWFA